MIEKNELLKGYDVEYPIDYTPQISNNLDTLLEAINPIRIIYANPMIVNSGWRPPTINKLAGGATKSKHLEGLACDIADPNGTLWKWVLLHLDLMQQYHFFFEDKRWTPTWVHFQLGSPLSGHRIFVPNASRPTDMAVWNGVYDTKYNEDIPSVPA